MKYKPQGIIDRQRKGAGVGEEENIFFLALHARSRTLASLEDVFEKNEKKNKITSVYRLDCYFNQHYQHRTNQKLRSCANAVLQNRGVNRLGSEEQRTTACGLFFHMWK